MSRLTWLGENRFEFKPDNIAAPSPGKGQVIVRVHSVGICGTDIHILQGHFPLARPPLVLGHEIAGEIVAVGAAVTKAKVGDHVTVDQVVGCGSCHFCQRGSTQFCLSGYELGITRDGGCQTYLVLPESNVYPVPDVISFEEAAVLDMEVWAALSKPGIRSGDCVVVIGAGPAGLVAAQLARVMGSYKVILVARSPGRLQIAEQLGFADVVLSSQRHDFAERIKAETRGFGADLTIDCAGNEESAKLAIECAIPGGRVVLFGVYPGPLPQFDVNSIVLRDLVIYGALSDRRGWEDVIALVAAGKLNLAPLITHRFPLSEAPGAYELAAAKAPGVVKVVLQID